MYVRRETRLRQRLGARVTADRFDADLLHHVAADRAQPDDGWIDAGLGAWTHFNFAATACGLRQRCINCDHAI